jgi:MFS family permease
MVLDAAGTDKIGVTLGWLSCANTAGFAIGPVLGGVLYKFGGWWAVFGTILGMISIDLCLRCTVIESGRLTEQEDLEISIAVESDLAGSSQHAAQQKKDKTFALLVLLRQPRMLCLLWGVIASGIIVSSFDAVSQKSSYAMYRQSPILLTHKVLDSSFVRPKSIWLERTWPRADLPANCLAVCIRSTLWLVLRTAGSGTKTLPKLT